MGIVFRMGVPFAQIANYALTRHPLRQSDDFVAKRHPLEQVAKPFVPCSGNRCLLNEQLSSPTSGVILPTRGSSLSTPVLVAISWVTFLA